jgi:hypothetical protein
MTATPATRLMIAVNTLLARGGGGLAEGRGDQDDDGQRGDPGEEAERPGRGEQQDVQQPAGEQRTCGGDGGLDDSGGAAQAARGRWGQYGYAQDAAGNEHAGHYHEGGHHGGGHATCPEPARIQRRRLFRLVDIQAIWGYHPGTSAQDVRGEDPYQPRLAAAARSHILQTASGQVPDRR